MCVTARMHVCVTPCAWRQVENRYAITTTDAERRCVTPEGLQGAIDVCVARYPKGRWANTSLAPHALHALSCTTLTCPPAPVHVGWCGTPRAGMGERLHLVDLGRSVGAGVEAREWQ
jgi:hypothetical protein